MLRERESKQEIHNEMWLLRLSGVDGWGVNGGVNGGWGGERWGGGDRSYEI